MKIYGKFSLYVVDSGVGFHQRLATREGACLLANLQYNGGLFTYETSHISILKQYGTAQLIIFLLGTDDCHNHPALLG
ncbi:hypothetical protein TIFTF001_054994 [Ficus carica]|uniref:Uncharacterized protein n=1 Tax=Ficus carica TaxID=3494 RepID=A0AA88EG86_FICCA|nr:hypothetical protein TIFTF001_054994 [Ficus carica]